MRRGIAILVALVIAGLAAGGVFLVTHGRAQRDGRHATSSAPRRSRRRRHRQQRRCADLSPRHRNRHCLQHRRRAQPDPGADHQDHLHRRTDRKGRRHARRNRSASLSGPTRSDDRHPRSRSGPTDQFARQSRPLQPIADQGRRHDPAGSTPKKRKSSSCKAPSNRTRRSSKRPRCSSNTRSSPRRSPGSPACARSM